MTTYDIPEFPSFLIVPLFTIGAVLTVIAYKRNDILNKSLDHFVRVP